MNNLNLKKIDSSKFPLIKIINNLPKNTSLFETILVTINDKLVYKFLEKKISFNKLVESIYKFSKFKKFQKFKKIEPKNVTDIYRLRDYVSLKIDTFSI